MKIFIVLAFGVTLAASAPRTYAQDPTVVTPTERSEKSDAARAQRSPTPEPGPTAAPLASPTPTQSVAPAAPTKKPVSPQKQTDAEAIIRELETRWVASIPKHDPSVAQEVLADDYAGVSAAGQVMTKRALVAQVQRDSDVYDAAKIARMEVRVFGTAAVVIGLSNERGKNSRGQPFARAYRWTDTWLLRDGRWQCVASQSLPVAR